MSDDLIAQELGQLRATIEALRRENVTLSKKVKGLEAAASLRVLARRYAGQRVPAWTTPELRERDLCSNCDGAPDGGHAGDKLCIRTLED